MALTRTVRLGTRSSALALWQANHVAAQLRRLVPDWQVELVPIRTQGDIQREAPLAQIGGAGLFTKELQRALQQGRIDVAVHSLKDLPTAPAEGLCLGAVPPRGPVGDAWVSTRWPTLAAVPAGGLVATSSVRRRAQLLWRRPDVQVVPVRGNVETRLRKLTEHGWDGLILAQAGLERLGRRDAIAEVLDPSWMLPAVGQGALGLECRADDTALLDLLHQIDDAATHQAVRAERAFLRRLGGGCSVPIAALAQVRDEEVFLRGAVLTSDGRQRLEGQRRGLAVAAEEVGQALAEELLQQGAAALLESAGRS
jgi:hydroxymethylbilane synthase